VVLRDGGVLGEGNEEAIGRRRRAEDGAVPLATVKRSLTITCYLPALFHIHCPISGVILTTHNWTVNREVCFLVTEFL